MEKQIRVVLRFIGKQKDDLDGAAVPTPCVKRVQDFFLWYGRWLIGEKKNRSDWLRNMSHIESPILFPSQVKQ